MFSLSIDHTPWKPERVECLAEMLRELKPAPGPVWIHDTDYRGRPWEEVKEQWALSKWRWHLSTDATHHVMMSDDLSIMPGFWRAVEGMVAAAPDSAIGCMSNHPDGPSLMAKGIHWYRCCAWLVGPCIIMPRTLLAPFVDWYPRFMATLHEGPNEHEKGFYHDDSSINEWLGRLGRTSIHPLPAPIEHRLEIGRSHDANPFPAYAAESVSWRAVNPADMTDPKWWANPSSAPLLRVV